METERRLLRRKPLSDCSNTITTTRKATSLLSSTISLVKPTKPSLSTAKKPEKKKNNSTKSDTPTANNAQNPSSVPTLPSTPLRLPNSSSTPTGIGEPLTVYGRRQNAEKRKKKWKMVARPLSCPPAARIKNVGDKLDEVGDVGPSKSCTVPCEKKPRWLPPEEDVSKRALPQDYIEQQRAYFAEIDAFELPVEIVSDSELE